MTGTALVLRHENGRKTPFTADTLAAREYLEEHLGIEQEECLIWPFSAPGGYGQIGIRHRTYRVTVLACEFRWGPMPQPRMHAAHGRLRRCESTLCWNGDHLSWKTAAENAMDKIRDGTQPLGEDFRSSVLTESDVLRLRERYALGGITQQELADECGVTVATVSYMLKHSTWKHVAGPTIPSRENHWNAGRSRKLTTEMVLGIRARHNSENVSNAQLAREYGVDASTVSNIVNRKAWAHL